MKFKKTIIKQALFTVLLMICAQQIIYSQSRRRSNSDNPGLYVGLSFDLSQNQITNEGKYSGSDLKSDKKNSFGGSAEIGYFISKYIGLSTGIGYISYKTQQNLDTYQNSFSSIDLDNEPYERRVTGVNIKEIQKVDCLNLPFCLNIHLPLSEKFGFFIQPGVNMSFPLNKTYTSSGTFTYKGYYSTYNVVLENLPEFGFPSDHNTVANGKLEIKPYIVSAIAVAGMDFFIQRNFQIVIAGYFSQSLSNMSAYKSPETFNLSSDVDQINSLMGGSSKVTFQSMEIKISFRYFLK